MLALPGFFLRKTTWKAKFSGFFLPLGNSFVSTFNETRAPTSRNYVAEQGIVMPNWSNMFQSFWSDSCVFALERQAKKLNFKSFVTFKRPFGGYFQWNFCIYFQEICSWTRYTNGKLIKYISSFLVALRRFCYRNTVLNLYFYSFFISKRIVGVYLQGNVCT